MESLNVHLGGSCLDARALRDAIDETLRLLRGDGAPDSWTLQDLRIGSATFDVAPTRDYSATRLLESTDRLHADEAPEEWTLTSLKAARSLAKLVGRYGVDSVEMTPSSTGATTYFTPELAESIDRILSPDRAATWTAISGHVVEWKSHGQLKVRTRSGKVHVSFDDAHRALAISAIDKHVELWGQVTKNASGGILQVLLADLEITDAPRPTPLDQFIGSLRDIEGFPQTVDEWLGSVRHGE